MSVLRYPIVVVPGIGGSVLTGPDGRSAWDLRAGDLARAVVGPKGLHIDHELRPTRLVDDLVVLRPWLVVPGYAALNRRLLGHWPGVVIADHTPGGDTGGYRAVDVLRVPYDFRRSIVEAADELGRAVTALVGSSGRTVVVVAHSLGGLVARYWIGPGRGWRQCRSLITLGTPHMGAPRALDWLVNGARVGGVSLGPATRVLRGWPAVHELLPRYSAVRPASGREIRVEALSPLVVRSFGDPDPGGVFLRQAADAAEVHCDIDNGWAEIPAGERPSVRCYFGRGHATPSRAVVRAERLEVTKDDPEWLPNAGWKGDGTVPAIASVPDELADDDDVHQAVPDRHGDMGSTAAVMERLVTLQGEKRKLHGDRPGAPWVGWDVDDVVAAGAVSEVAVAVQRGADGPADVVGESAILVVAGPGGRSTMPMTEQGSGWRAVVPPLMPGVYRLDVEVKNAHAGTSVFGSARTAVIDLVIDPAEEES